MSEHEEQIFNLFIIEFFNTGYSPKVSNVYRYETTINTQWFPLFKDCFPVNESTFELLSAMTVNYIDKEWRSQP